MTSVTIPLAIKTSDNLREHHFARHKRVKMQRGCVLLALPVRKLAAERNWLNIKGRILVVLTRISPRRLDSHDNLRSAFKAVVDQLAAQLGVDDRDHRLGFVYQQETGQPAVRIELKMLSTEALIAAEEAAL